MELLSTTVGQVIVGVLVLINLWAFFLMGRDKKKSINTKHVRRMPEGQIFFWAAAFGAVGVYLGMISFRHKTKKWYFKLGIPMLMVQNVALVYVVWLFFIN